MDRDVSVFENSWKDFTAQIQKQQKLWTKITDEYLDQMNNSRKEISKIILEQCDVTFKNAEEVLEKSGESIKEMEKENTEKFARDLGKANDVLNKVSDAAETTHDVIADNWDAIKTDIQKKWAKLTNDNLEQINGNREKLTGAIQKQYGIARDEAERQMREWEKNRKNFRKSG